MKTIARAGLALLFMGILSSCQLRIRMEKRTFREGYYLQVAHQGKGPGQFTEGKDPKSRDLKENFLNAEKLVQASTGLPGLSKEGPVTCKYVSIVKDTGKAEKKGKVKGKEDRNFRYDPDRSTPDAEKRNSPLAVISVISAVLAFFSLFLNFAGVAVFGLASIILAILARRQIRKNPDRYSGYGLTVASFLLAGITLIVTAWLVLNYFGS